MRGLIVFVIGWSLAPVLVTVSQAQTCRAACGSEVRACVQSARTEASGCRAVCREAEAPTDVHACTVGCRSDLRAAIKSCRSGVGDCIGSCSAVPAASASCFGQCGQALGACEHGIASDQTACIRNCANGPGKADCIGACRDAAESGGQACLDAASACRGGCGLPETTTSTTAPVTTTSTTGPVTTTSTTLQGSPNAAFLE